MKQSQSIWSTRFERIVTFGSGKGITIQLRVKSILLYSPQSHICLNWLHNIYSLLHPLSLDHTINVNTSSSYVFIKCTTHTEAVVD